MLNSSGFINLSFNFVSRILVCKSKAETFTRSVPKIGLCFRWRLYNVFKRQIPSQYLWRKIFLTERSVLCINMIRFLWKFDIMFRSYFLNPCMPVLPKPCLLLLNLGYLIKIWRGSKPSVSTWKIPKYCKAELRLKMIFTSGTTVEWNVEFINDERLRPHQGSSMNILKGNIKNDRSNFRITRILTFIAYLC